MLAVGEAWSAAGKPSAKLAPVVPVVLGRELTEAYISRARSKGIDYLLWIDLDGNSVEYCSRQWQSTRTEYPSCSCGKIKNGGKDVWCRSGSSCCGDCRSSCRIGRDITVYHCSETATRHVGASYLLLDTTTGRPVWRADAAHSQAEVNSSTSESGYPPAPARPLPPEEWLIMRRMSNAVIDKLPR